MGYIIEVHEGGARRLAEKDLVCWDAIDRVQLDEPLRPDVRGVPYGSRA